MKILICCFLTFWLSSFSYSQRVNIKGEVLESLTSQPVINAVVSVYQDTVLIAGFITDFDGRFSLELLQGIPFNFEVHYDGAKTSCGKIIFNSDTCLSFTLFAGVKLETVIVTECKVPIIRIDKTTNDQTITSEDIKSLGIRSLSRTSKSNKKGKEISIRGSRKKEQVYFMDGVVTNGVTRGVKNCSSENKKVRAGHYLTESTEEYQKIHENDFQLVKANPLSTFSIDVDRASYSNVRRFINERQKVPPDAVRIEEMINYFDYKYPQPTGAHPYRIVTEYSGCPWNSTNKLLMIALQGKTVDIEKLPPTHLTFLIDVSGSMEDENKLPLVILSLKLLVEKLRAIDKVSLVVYAGSSGLVLEACPGDEKDKINNALDRLEAGGSTAGASGIELAYKVAKENFINEGNNRVVLCTDGDFNVGVSNVNDLEDLIVSKRKTGVYLTCLGFGMGNYKDEKIKTLADKGNGNYAYIDNYKEAKKMLEHEFGGTLYTIAKDVKVQVEFNPAQINSYRLVGYEDRLLNEEDFVDDSKDAGEMGSGHVVTVLYEIRPKGIVKQNERKVDDLKYSKSVQILSNDLATVKTRYKKPQSEKSIEYNEIVRGINSELNLPSSNFNWCSSVAMFGMILRNSEHKGTATRDRVIHLAQSVQSKDYNSTRSEFVQLVENYIQ